MVAKILIVSNEMGVRNFVMRHLSLKNYQVRSVADPESALAACEQFAPDLVILDDNLPDAISYELCQSLKRHASSLLLILTPRRALQEKTKSFWRGCDDFLIKSFDAFLLELECRIKALLTRHSEVSPAPVSVLTFDNLTIDPICREVTVNQQDLGLTTLEFDLLYCLTSSPGRVWRREELIRQVWSYEYIGNPRVVDIHIANLRKKLRGASPSIETVKGVGYKFVASSSKEQNFPGAQMRAMPSIS